MSKATVRALEKIKKAKLEKATLLELSNCGLEALPKELLELPWLENLVLEENEAFPLNNQLKELPSWLGQLKHLNRINLVGSKANLVNIPGLILDYGHYLKFQSIVSRENVLGFSIKDIAQLTPILQFEALKELECHDPSLQELPREIGQLKNLTVLDLRRTKAKTLPPEIAHLEKLEVLNLGGLPIPEFPEVILRLHNLQWLGLGGTQISHLPPSINQLKKLKTLLLWETKLTEFPMEVLSIPGLTSLNLGGNQITAVPAEINKLSQLESLGLWNTNLKEFPKEVLQLPNLRLLFLNNLPIQPIPPEIARLTNLEDLYLHSTNIVELPEELAALTNLRILELSNTPIEQFPEVILKLKNLQYLSFHGTPITTLPKEITQLSQLEHLDLSRSKIKKLPREITQIPSLYALFLDETSFLEDPPQEIASQGIEAIRNYFAELEKGAGQLYESKLLILGEGGAGKTSLCKKILHSGNYELNSEELTTEGIDINTYHFSVGNGRDFRMNIWDFGGQEIYHATHQFFLTKRSLYVLLEDTRTEDTDFNYWLQAIELLSDNSPVIIVQNEKQDRKRALNEGGLRGRFKNLLQVMPVNLLTNRGVPELLNRIHSEIRQLPHIGEKLPKGWVLIRQELEGLSKANHYIDLKDYLKICQKHGLATTERALFLSDYLHDLGIFLHFQDNPILKRTIILRPEWGTDAVYKVLDNPKVRDVQKGRFSKKDLNNIWKEERYTGMQDELLELMMKFELCYQIGETDEFIAPELLPANQPDYAWNEKDNLVLRYDYDFMPKGIMTRFIVRRHNLIKSQDLAWKDGVILEREGAEGEVIQTYGKRDIRIRVSGRNRKELLTLIMDEFDRIHEAFPKLQVNKLIPCNCSECKERVEPFLFRYADLRKAKEKGVKALRCMKSFEEVSISPLIDEYFMSADYPYISGSGIKGILKTALYLSTLKFNAFISYSHQDESLKNKFQKSIKPLNRLSQIEAWDDRQIKPGTEWQKEIHSKLESARIIFLLISPDFIDSEFCQMEMEYALERKRAGDTIVIPIILRPCLWEDMPFGKLQALPGNGKAISTWDNEDEAFLDVVKGVKKLIEEISF